MKNKKNNIVISILSSLLILAACGGKQQSSEPSADAFENMDTSHVFPTFFPVNSFIRGEIEMLKQQNKKIIRVQKPKGVTDSVEINFTDWEKEMNVLLSPPIDSTALSVYFIENKFLDQSIGSITLTYDTSENIPDSIPWKNWIVYINPEDQQVNRIYLVKKNGTHMVDQITWVPGKFCKWITINSDPNCKLNKTDEKMFIWGD